MPFSSFHHSTDSQIWTAFKEGEPAAYEYLYAHYFPLLYNYGRHITRREALVEDAIQELFIYLLQHRQQLTDVQSIKFYLFRALRRRIHQALVKDGRHTATGNFEGEYDFEVTFPHEQVLIHDQLEREQHQALQDALAALPKRQKEALFLIFYENMSYKEAASIMSLEVKTLYNFIYNALGQLRKHLDKIFFLLLTPLS